MGKHSSVSRKRPVLIRNQATRIIALDLFNRYLVERDTEHSLRAFNSLCRRFQGEGEFITEDEVVLRLAVFP
jgi:hypothetical protein